MIENYKKDSRRWQRSLPLNLPSKHHHKRDGTARARRNGHTDQDPAQRRLEDLPLMVRFDPHLAVGCDHKEGSQDMAMAPLDLSHPRFTGAPTDARHL